MGRRTFSREFKLEAVNLDTSRNPDFWDRDGRVGRGQALCVGVANITLLEDGRRGADVGARCGCRPYAVATLLLSQTNRVML
ncbi:hypothetical protein [Falsiroseomonas sp.]|uniref:hypothetical protein n=1 Tax=Falsiroseomonas sp. TaxID=2870721 RepID=UPI002735C103|nr:hypothetical protein [Falsiroseomonas sp.]MDP3415089.1 hypothetical protein [Falsiroseomonas sp.]